MLHTHEQQVWYAENNVDGIGTGFALKNAETLHREQTDYQMIEIYSTETFGKLMVFDDLIMLSERDNFFYHEMLSHPVILSHRQPKQVVIIGGGDCGTLREVLKHPDIDKVTQIEIDARVTELAEEFFPELCSANDDPRAQLLFADGIEWMANCPDASIDIIIIDSTDPIGPATGLFKEPFYKDCLRVLRNDGMLAQQSESPLLHLDVIHDMHAALRQVGFAQTQLIPFPQPTYPSGWWSATIACKHAMALTPRDAAQLETFYYSKAILQSAMVLPPFVKQRLATNPAETQ